MEDNKDNGILEKTEEVIENIDPSEYKLVKKRQRQEPTEKQLKSRQANGERLKKIMQLKKADKEKILKEHEIKLVAELKDKWKKEYEEEKSEKPNNTIGVPKNMIQVRRKRSSQKKVVIKEFPSKPKPEEQDSDGNESSDTDDDHIPKYTDCESTDTTVIKKKIAKVKQIEQAVQKQVVNPYLSMLEKYYK